MAWTPPSKFTVIISFLLMAFGIFILLDRGIILWDPILPYISIFGFAAFQSWLIIASILLIVAWLLFYLGVVVKGM